MKFIRSIVSASGVNRIEIMQHDDGAFVFQKYTTLYDPDEGIYYESKSSTNPGGRYGDLDIALQYAEMFLKEADDFLNRDNLGP